MPQRNAYIAEQRKYDNPAKPTTSPYDVILPATSTDAVIEPTSGKAVTVLLAGINTQKSNVGHKHAATDITSGTLAVARGGTGATSLASVTVGNALKFGSKLPADFALITQMNTALAKKANITQPPMYNFSLPSGFLSELGHGYSRDQFGRVYLDIDIVKPGGTFGLNCVIATLPEGFRPKNIKNMAVTTYESVKGYISGIIVINNVTGEIKLEENAANSFIVRGCVSFWN